MANSVTSLSSLPWVKINEPVSGDFTSPSGNITGVANRPLKTLMLVLKSLQGLTKVDFFNSSIAYIDTDGVLPEANFYLIQQKNTSGSYTNLSLLDGSFIGQQKYLTNDSGYPITINLADSTKVVENLRSITLIWSGNTWEVSNSLDIDLTNDSDDLYSLKPNQLPVGISFRFTNNALLSSDSAPGLLLTYKEITRTNKKYKAYRLALNAKGIYFQYSNNNEWDSKILKIYETIEASEEQAGVVKLYKGNYSQDKANHAVAASYFEQALDSVLEHSNYTTNGLLDPNSTLKPLIITRSSNAPISNKNWFIFTYIVNQLNKKPTTRDTRTQLAICEDSASSNHYGSIYVRTFNSSWGPWVKISSKDLLSNLENSLNSFTEKFRTTERLMRRFGMSDGGSNPYLLNPTSTDYSNDPKLLPVNARSLDCNKLLVPGVYRLDYYSSLGRTLTSSDLSTYHLPELCSGALLEVFSVSSNAFIQRWINDTPNHSDRANSTGSCYYRFFVTSQDIYKNQSKNFGWVSLSSSSWQNLLGKPTTLQDFNLTDFGSEQNYNVSKNLNDYTKTGVYTFLVRGSADLLNSPENRTGEFALCVFSIGPASNYYSKTIQICYTPTGSYTRHRNPNNRTNDTNWSPWVKELNRNEVVLKSDSSLVGVPPGTIVAYAGTTIPNGWIQCNGSALSRTTYSALFSAIGTAYGSGNGVSTFNIPDLRGQFIRGFDAGSGKDNGRAFASHQADAIQQITGGFTLPPGYDDIHYSLNRNNGDSHEVIGHPLYGVFDIGRPRSAISTELLYPLKTYTFKHYDQSKFNQVHFNSSRVVRSATETRPTNIALNYIIKY